MRNELRYYKRPSDRARSGYVELSTYLGEKIPNPYYFYILISFGKMPDIFRNKIFRIPGDSAVNQSGGKYIGINYTSQKL